MRLRDALLIIVAFAGIAAGIFLPQWAKPLEWFPRISLMIILYLSFLGLKTDTLFSSAKALRPKLIMLVAGKLLLAPLVTFVILSYTMPQFALGGLLMAGAPAGVTSSVFAALVGADFTLAMMGVVLTSLLSPFTLPVLASLALQWLDKSPNAMARFSPLDMSVNMATMILVPFVLAKITIAVSPKLTTMLEHTRFWVSTLTIGITNLAVFAKYSPVLRQNPELLLPALWAALLCALVFLVTATLLSWRWPGPQQGTLCLCFGATNSILAMILGMEFFGMAEALPGAMFAIPTVLMVLPVRGLMRWRRRQERKLQDAEKKLETRAITTNRT